MMGLLSDDSDSSFSAGSYCSLNARGNGICNNNNGRSLADDEKRYDKSDKLLTATSVGNSTILSKMYRQQLPKVTDALVQYWYNDLPPLFGPLRMVFYGMYWFITNHADWFLFHSRPTRDTFYYGYCVSHLSVSIPHFGNLGFEYKREGGLFNYFFLQPGHEILLQLNPFWTCSVLTWAFWSGLVLSCLGLGGKVPRYMVAVSFWMLFGIRNAQFVGESSHSHYLAGMAMTALCFAENNLIDGWSLDSWILKTLGVVQRSSHSKQPSSITSNPAFGGPSSGGAARKYILFMAVCSIFFAGMHKFSTWGFKWMDGEALYKCLEEEHSHWEFVHDIFYENRFLVTLLAIGTIVGEVGAFAVLFFPRWRPYGIASFYAFHIGVFILMQPNFISNEVTYLLIMDWRGLWRKIIAGMPHFTRKVSGFGIAKPLMTQQNTSLPLSTSGHPSFNFPQSWRVGAWVYTLLATAVLVTSVCRIDAFPFFSWSLYNWHPSEPGDQSPYTKEVVEEAANRCLTKPPFNPACQNHGTTRHHDLFPTGIDEYLYTVTVTGIKEGSSKSAQWNHDCPIAVYVNWKPVACQFPKTNLSLIQQLDAIIGAASSTSMLEKAPSPKTSLLPAEKIARTLKRYAVDAAAAAISEGPTCFDADAKWLEMPDDKYDTRWSNDLRPLNPVSRFSRQVRAYMNKPENEGKYVGEGREVLAVGVVFEYREYVQKESKTEKKYNYCMLGKSITGEDVEDAFSNHHIGGSIAKSKLPAGDWSEVFHEDFLIVLLGLVTVGFPFLPSCIQIFQQKLIKTNKQALLLGSLGLFVITHAFWGASTTSRLIS